MGATAGGTCAQAGLLPALCSPALPTLPSDPSTVKLDNFPIHAITGVLKQWLRELPEPLMTFAQYGDFLRAVGESCDGGKGRQVADIGVVGMSTLWPAREAGPPSHSEETKAWGGTQTACGPAFLPHTAEALLSPPYVEVGLRGADTLAFLELPEKQEQLAAIYAVLEHLPEANHNSLERLIFHLVKQVPAATVCGMGGSLQEAPLPTPGECSLLVLHQDVGPC